MIISTKKLKNLIPVTKMTSLTIKTLITIFEILGGDRATQEQLPTTPWMEEVERRLEPKPSRWQLIFLGL